jgi:MFS family permease
MSSGTLPGADPAPLRQDAAVIALVGLAHASSHFSHLLLPLMFPVFMGEFGLTFSELGLLMTLFFVVSGVGQAVAGFVVDRLGARPLLFASLVLLMLACVAAGRAQSYGALMLAAVLAGLGNASFHPVDFTILNQRVSGPRLGHAFSAHGLSGNLGWALAPAFFATLSALAGWRAAYGAAALGYAVVLVILYQQRQYLVAGGTVRRAQPAGLDGLAFLSLPVVWWCFGFFLLSTMTLAVVQNFSVSILKALYGVSFEAATFTLTAYMLCGALGMLLGGFVAARATSSDRVVAATLTVATALLALCATGWLGATGTMAVLAGTGLAIGIGGPSRDMMIKRATPREATGRVYGTVYSGLDVGFALAPFVFGIFMDHGWYAATLLGAAFTLLLSVVAALAVGRRSLAPNH